MCDVQGGDGMLPPRKVNTMDLKVTNDAMKKAVEVFQKSINDPMVGCDGTNWAADYEQYRNFMKKISYEANTAGRVATKHLPDGPERIRTYLTESLKVLNNFTSMNDSTLSMLGSLGATSIKFI
jgi:hypothetical protein